MKIDIATSGQVYRVARDMRDRDFAEFCALADTDDRSDLAHGLVRRCHGRSDVLCGSLDGVPVCIGGMMQGWPGVITLMFFATPDFPKIALPITRFITRELFPRYEAAGIHRIQAISLDGYEEAHRWMGLLGLTRETGPMPGYGKRGEAFVQFARVSDVRQACAAE